MRCPWFGFSATRSRLLGWQTSRWSLTYTYFGSRSWSLENWQGSSQHEVNKTNLTIIKVNDFHLARALSAVSMSARNSSAGVYPNIIKRSSKRKQLSFDKTGALTVLAEDWQGRCESIGESTPQFLHSRPHCLRVWEYNARDLSPLNAQKGSGSRLHIFGFTLSWKEINATLQAVPNYFISIWK